MGGFADLLIAADQEAGAIARSDDPTQVWPGASLGSLNYLDFVSLYALLLGEDLNSEAVMGKLLDAFEFLQPPSRSRPGVVKFPPPFTRGLAALDDTRLSELAAAWAETEELDGLWEAEDLTVSLAEMRRLSVQAQDKQQSLLLSISGM